MEWQLQQASHAPQSKFVKGYLAFIQGLLVVQSALTHYSLTAHLALTRELILLTYLTEVLFIAP